MSIINKARNFFFCNITHKQTILKNTFWLGVSQGFSGIVNFSLIIFIAQTLGPSEYGKFAFAFSFVSLFSTLFDFGISTAILREFAKHEEKQKHFVDLLSLKFVLGICVLIIIFCSSFFISHDESVRIIVILLGIYVLLLDTLNFFYVLLRSQARMEKEAGYRILHAVITAGVVFIVLYSKKSVLLLSYAYVGSAFFILIFLVLFYYLYNKQNISFKPSINIKIWKEFLSVGWYLALSKGAGDITVNTDSVMLGCSGQLKEVGWYNSAAKINGLFLFPMAIVSSAFLPSLITILGESKEKFIRYWEFWMRITIIFAVYFCSFVLIRSDSIIELVYSKSYYPASLALKILSVMALFTYIHNMFFQVMFIFDQQKIIFQITFLAAILNVILNLILIGRFSLYGAAVATVITNFAILISYIILTPKHTIIKPFNKNLIFTMTISIFSGALMILTFWVFSFKNINLFLSIFYGSLMYLVYYSFLNKVWRNIIFVRN